MSNNRIGNNSPGFQLGTPRKLERTTSTGDVRQDSGIEVGKQRGEALLRRTDSGHLPKLGEKPKDVLSDESVSQSLETGLDKGTTPVKRTAFVPKPGELMKARGELSPTVTVEKTGLDRAQQTFTQDTQHALDSAPRPSSQSIMSDTDFTKGVGSLLTQQVRDSEKAYGKALMEAERELPGKLQQGFKPAFDDYIKATNTRFGSKTSQVAEDALQTKIRNAVASCRQDSDLGIVLANKSDAELRKIASDMVASYRGYNAKDMAKLSERKQHFIDAMVRGMREGITASQQQAVKETDSLLKNGEFSEFHGNLPPKGKIAASLDTLRQSMQDSIKALPFDSPMREALVYSSPERFSEALSANLGVKHAGVLKAMTDASLSSDVSENLVMGLKSGTAGSKRVTPANLPQKLAGLTLPDTILIGKTYYNAPSYVASGSFADVFSYTNPRSGEQVIVKRCKDEHGQKGQEMMADECRSHLALQGKQPQVNVTGFKAMVRAGNELYSVQEAATGGDLEKVSAKLWDLRKRGVISEDVHQLLGLHLLRGTLRGMSHIQNEQQGHHFDLKLPNVLLSDSGIVKIGDFGFAGIGTGRSAARLQGIDNPLYKAPEQVRGNQTLGERPDELVSNRSDTWNAGVMAYTLLRNPDQQTHQLWSNPFGAKIEDDVEVFGRQPDGRIMPTAPHKDGGQGMGLNAIDKLINGLMQPGAEQRSNFEAALQNSAFKDPRLERPQLRQLLALLGSGKPQDQGFDAQVANLARSLTI